MTTRSLGMSASGIVPIVQARTGRKCLLVITDTPRMARAWYERSRPAGGFTGWYVPAAFGSDVPPFTRAISLPTNVTAGATFWPYRHDGQPGTGGTTYRAYVYDTGATALDLTDGLSASFVTNGARELMWDPSTPVGSDAEIARCSLSGSYTQVQSPTWYRDALTVKILWHGPAEDATGANPIIGSPSLSIGYWRDADAPTVSAESGASTNAGMFSQSATLAAGAGLPRVAFYHPTASDFENLGTRACLNGFFMRSSTATRGLDIVVIDLPTLQHLDIGLVADESNDGNGGGVAQTALQALEQRLEVNIDAVVVQLASNIGAGFANLSGNDDLSDLVDGITSPGIWAEYNADVENSLHGAFGDIPIVFCNSWYYGQASDAALSSTSFANANTIRRTIDQEFRSFIQNHGSTVFGSQKSAYLNFYDYGGSDGVNSPTTQNNILTGAGSAKLIQVNGSGAWGAGQVRGNWAASTAYVQGDVVLDAAASGIKPSGAVPHYVCNTAHTSTVAKTGVVDDGANTAKWTVLDFEPTDVLANALVDLFWSEIEAAESSGGSLRGSRAAGRSQRPIGGVR